MAWKIFDFECSECGHQFEDMVKGETDHTECSECGYKKASKVFSGCAIASYSIMSPEFRNEHLKKRSSDHTKKYKKKHYGIE